MVTCTAPKATTTTEVYGVRGQDAPEKALPGEPKRQEGNNAHKREEQQVSPGRPSRGAGRPGPSLERLRRLLDPLAFGTLCSRKTTL